MISFQNSHELCSNPSFLSLSQIFSIDDRDEPSQLQKMKYNVKNTIQSLYSETNTAKLSVRKVKSLTKYVHTAAALSYHDVKDKILSIFITTPFFNWKDRKGYNFFERIIVQGNAHLISHTDFSSVYKNIGQNGLHTAIHNRDYKALSKLTKSLPECSLLQMNKTQYTALEEAIYICHDEKAALYLLDHTRIISKFISTNEKVQELVEYIVRHDFVRIFTHFVHVMQLFEGIDIRHVHAPLAQRTKSRKIAHFLYEKQLSNIWHAICNTQVVSSKDIIYQIAGKTAQKVIGIFRDLGSKRDIYPIFSQLWKTFTRTHPDWTCKRHIGQAIKIAIDQQTHNVDIVVRRLVQGKCPVIIETGYSRHSITVVFYNSLVCICNRGHGVPTNNKIARYIQIARYDRKNITVESIAKLLKLNGTTNAKKAFRYIYKKFFNKIRATPQPGLENKILKICRFTDQKNDNCLVTSLKIAIFAILISQYTSTTLPYSKIKQCHAIYKAFSTWTKIQAISLYIANKGTIVE